MYIMEYGKCNLAVWVKIFHCWFLLHLNSLVYITKQGNIQWVIGHGMGKKHCKHTRLCLIWSKVFICLFGPDIFQKLSSLVQQRQCIVACGATKVCSTLFLTLASEPGYRVHCRKPILAIIYDGTCIWLSFLYLVKTMNNLIALENKYF